MSPNPSIVFASFVAGLVLVLGMVLVDRADDDVHISAASADALDRLPAHFPTWVASLQHPPPTYQTTTTQAKRAAPRVMGQGTSTAGTVNGYPCGGDLPPCRVLACESGGNPTAQNPRSSASGLWQILDGTWNGFGGYARAFHAPPSVQNDKARQLWAGGAGAFHWRSCL